ncbi:MAG: pilus assembly protein PilO [Cyanobacteria bacterium P01_F01_bin.42]
MDDGFNTPSYPTAFGITFTPKIIGIVTAVVGVGLAGYIGLNMVSPELEKSSELKEAIELKQIDLERKQAAIARQDDLIAELRAAKGKQRQVLGLFSEQKALDTLLLDLNRLITSSNASLSKFTPNYDESGIVSDGSLGPELNYMLKRQVTDVAFSGTFAQSLSIMQAIDKLQTVLVIEDLKMEVGSRGKDDVGPPKVSSNFKLYAYVPLSEEEIRAAKQAQQAQEQEQDG